MAVGRAQYRKVGHREKRKDRRVLFPPLSIVVEGATYETANWSFGGFMIEGASSGSRVGAEVFGTLGSQDRRYPFVGRVTRTGGEMRELAVSFTDISDEALLYLDGRLSDYLSSKRSG
jgi:hypothetical protein